MRGLRAVVACAAAAGVACAQQPGCDAFHVYFNNGGAGSGVDFCALDVSQWLIAPSKMTVTGKVSCLPGADYGQWQQGVWPYINSAGDAVAGGVPQAANLSLHLDTVRATLRFWVPDFAAYEGNAVIDMEYWRPDFAALAPPYRNLSIALVRAAHPQWNESSVEEEAGRAFEAAALDFMEATLRTYTELMPLARVGFYGYPANYYYPCAGDHNTTQCGYNFPGVGASLRAKNDAQARIFAASTSLFPSIYLPSRTNTSAALPHHEEYVAATVAEALRLRDAHAPRARVLPFAWNFYHDGGTLLLPADMAAELAGPPQSGADGVILWGAPVYYNQTGPTLQYLKATLGPLARQTVAGACACAAQRCSGHGACTAQGGCRCLPGFSGPSCSGTSSSVPAA
jgi:hypothetical protein